jgi:hypothetical protein
MAQHFRILAQVWTGGYPPQQPRSHALVEKLLVTPLILLRTLSLGNLKGLFSVDAGHLFMDLYVLSFAAVLTVVLFTPGHLAAIGTAIAAYRVVDIVSYRLYFLLVKSQARPWEVRVLRRSLAIVLVNLYETVIGYAIIYLTVANIQNTSGCGTALKTPVSALYYSAVTIVTLGYGDLVPADDPSRLIVVSQLLAAVIFLIFLIPALISLFSDREE